MEDMPLLDKRDQVIVIEEGVIKDIVPSSEAPFGEEWEVYDVRGAVVIPALTECTLMPFLQGQSSRISCSHTGRNVPRPAKEGALMPQ